MLLYSFKELINIILLTFVRVYHDTGRTQNLAFIDAITTRRTEPWGSWIWSIISMYVIKALSGPKKTQHVAHVLGLEGPNSINFLMQAERPYEVTIFMRRINEVALCSMGCLHHVGSPYLEADTLLRVLLL
jgi:hypothetical protein